ncbi:NB-ARC domain-containing protein [Citrus sinensis]|nr:NB-ARC domain-containing protein [Citrus sinensis]
MDINLGLFSERLRRVLAAEEFTVPDAAEQPIQNLYTETEIVASWLRDSGYNTAWDTVGLDNKIEELLDLLTEGPPQLSVVAILDSIGLDKTAFAVEAYSSNYVKYYFDCHAWVEESLLYDADQILYDIIKFVMPSSRLSEIMEESSEMKKIILHEYLMTKRYLIVLDNVWRISVWDVIREILPDSQNGSRVLITLSRIEIVASFQFENGENIGLDFLSTGGPLRVTYQGWPFHILYHESISLKENIEEALDEPRGLQVLAYFRRNYLSVLDRKFVPVISTKQLYQLWIAKGFIPDNNEAIAKRYLEQLSNGGFVDVGKKSDRGRINTCSIPGRCSPALLTAAFEGEFVISPIMDQEVKLRENVKRFTAHGNLNDFEFLDHFDSFLHSLLHLTSGSHYLDPNYCEKICKMFNFLRVLDLGSLVLIRYPSEVENLFLLRYLKLNIPSLKSLL